MLITDQVIYEVCGSILQEPVVRQAALTLEKCLLRASSLGDKKREIPRKEDHESNRGSKQKLSGGMSILGHSMSCGEAMEKWSISELWCKGWGEEVCPVPKLQ